MTNVAIPTPFVGLRPFDREDAHLFFGRDAQVDALTACLRDQRFVAVMGTSGSGKSSLVRAGLLPALEGGGVAGGGTGWSIAVMTPGANPIGNLAVALARAGIGPRSMPADHQYTTIEAILRRGALGLVDAVRESGLGPDDSLLVFVDQFEEIFRFKRLAQSAGGQDHAAAFVKLLLTALRQSSPAIYVMLTMRSEFLGEAAEFRDLPEAINDGLFLVPRLTRDQLTQAICGPIAVGGGKITPSLVQRLLNDVGDDPDQLPVLQHALMRTWKQWCVEGAMPSGLTIEHYETVKGLAGALSAHADAAFLEIAEGQRTAAATIFKALTERGPDGREVRRPTSVRELADIAGIPAEDVIAIVEPFRRKGRTFLVPPGTQPITADTVLDISHESLMRKWDRLRDWIAQEAEDRRIFLRLSDSAAQYAAGEEPLLRDPRLSFVAQWRTRFAPVEPWARRYAPNFKEAVSYLDTSLTTRRHERHRRQMLRGVILLLIGGLAFFYHRNEDRKEQLVLEKRQHAIDTETDRVQRQARDLEAQQRILKAEQDADNSKRKEQEATEKQHAEQKKRGEEAAKQVVALNEAQRETQRLAIGATAAAARANPAESEVAALVALRSLSNAERANDTAGVKNVMAALAEQIRLMPVVRLREELGSSVSVLGASGLGILAAVSPSSRVSPQVHTWRVGAGRLSPARAPARITAALGAWDSTGRTTAWISGGAVHVWDEELGEGPALTLPEGGRPTRLTLSPDGRYVLVARGATGADLWSLTTRTSVHLDAGYVDDMACAADGRSCVTATREFVRLWNTETGAQTGQLRLRDASAIRSIALSSTGALLAVAAGAGATTWIEVWRVARDEGAGVTFSSIGPRAQPHTNSVNDIAISANERFIASASDDGTTAIFTVPPGTSPLSLFQRLSHGRASVLRVVFGPDADVPALATAVSDGTARLWRRSLPARSPSTRLIEQFRVPHSGRITALAFLDEDLLASADEKGVVRVSSSPSGAVPTTPGELMNTACGRVSRTLTAAEWMSYFRLQPYESLCRFPLDPRQVLEVEIAHAQAGNTAQARHAARQFAAITDTHGLDPSMVASAAGAQARIHNTDVAREHFKLAVSLAQAVKSEERGRPSNEVCWQGVVNGFAADVLKACDDAVRTEPESTDFLTDAAIAYARAGNRDAASERFKQAAQLVTARPRGPGSENNEVCWRGSIYDFANEVRAACDAAVAASQKNVAFLDSQAVAYALIGAPELVRKAKENFKYFVDNPGNYPGDIVAKRKTWCDEIDKGRNPFARDRRRGVLAELAKDFEQQRVGSER